MHPRTDRQQSVALFVLILATLLSELGCTAAASHPAAHEASVNAASFCSALAVIKSNCQQCHGSALIAGAPMSLVSYADFQAPARSNAQKRVFEMIASRIHDPLRPMPEPPAVLSPDALATLDSWIAAGAQSGADPSCAAANGGAGGAGGSGGAAGAMSTAGSGINVGMNNTAGDSATVAGTTGGSTNPSSAGSAGAAGTMSMADEWPADCQDHYVFLAYDGTPGTKHRVAAGMESHPQFYFDVPWGNDHVQALHFKPIIDNAKILHHWILYNASDAQLFVWAPGRVDRPLPADVGLYMPTASDGKIRLDTHYNNTSAGAGSELDASGVEVCVTRNFRPNTAGVRELHATVNLPAHQMAVNTATCTAQVSGGPVHILSVMPHMHKLGIHGHLGWKPGGGAEQVLHDGPFSFNEQRDYPLDNVLVKSGDSLVTTCTYENTTDSAVRYGLSTSEEMCFNWITYYPMNSLTCGNLIPL